MRSWFSQIAAIPLFLFACGGVAGDVRAQSGNPSVAVFLQNDGIAPPDVAARAQTEVVRLYRLIGVEATWVTRTPDASGKPAPVVALVAWEPSESVVAPSVLGLTYGNGEKRGSRGYVFWRRIERASDRYRVCLYNVLAAAIAHELGHMLLPNGSHAAHGLMAEPWDINHLRAASAGFLHFSTETGSLIRRRLNDEKPSTPFGCVIDQALAAAPHSWRECKSPRPRNRPSSQ